MNGQFEDGKIPIIDITILSDRRWPQTKKMMKKVNHRLIDFQLFIPRIFDDPEKIVVKEEDSHLFIF